MAYSSYPRSSTTRGSSAYRGGGRNAASTAGPQQNVLDGLGDSLATFELPKSSATEGIKLENVHAVASYNWVEGAAPKIMVPGSPPIWQDLTLPYKVEKDSGMVFVDQNAYRIPDHPLASLFASVKHMEPDFDFAGIDIVSDRNSLRKLLRWIAGKGVPGAAKDFRFDVEMAGTGTLLFTRREMKNQELSGNSYGHNFERAFTIAAMGSIEPTGYHRIVTYDFDGLRMLVRYEVDACLPEPAGEKPTRSGKSVDDLLARFAGLSMTANEATEANKEKQVVGEREVDPLGPALESEAEPLKCITVVQSGALVPQSRVLELTSRSAKFISTFEWIEVYPQLYLSQTPHHHLGLHEFGKFTKIEKRQLAAMTQIAQQYQGNIRKLASALHDIVTTVVQLGPGKPLSLACVNGELKLYETKDGKRALPEELLKIF